jgi:hypothetical protein
MPTIPRFEPPAALKDFTSIAKQKKAWSEYLNNTFAEEVAAVTSALGGGTSQFYNPLTTSTDAPVAAKTIQWKGFPLLIHQKHPGNKKAAWQEADEVLANGERPQDEYLEWHVTRNAQEKIVRVTFTCEGPEYWEALAHGYPLRYTGPKTAGATGNRNKLLALYRTHISPDVQLADLFSPSGRYNTLNKWNTHLGAMHLNQRNNTLGAEINIAAQATILRQQNGVVITDADELIRCARFGSPGRASDPRIGAEVNALAREGFAITLQNPVGLYIDVLDTTGWKTPTTTPASRYWKSVRGAAGMTVRAVFEVPPSEGFTVSDIKIGGQFIEFGGQIAENITVKLTGLACRKGQISNVARPCPSHFDAAGAMAMARGEGALGRRF